MSQRQAHWGEYLPQVKVVVAVEVKMWLARWSDFQQRAGWDIRKLTDRQNAVGCPYLLNFVQLDFSRQQMKDYYHRLQKHLIERAEQCPQLKILYVSSNTEIQPQSDNWVSASK